MNRGAGNRAGFRRLTRRENRDDAARAIDQLMVGDEIAQPIDQFARKQFLSFNDDEHIELAQQKPPRHLLVFPEFRGVRTEQLAEQIVDLQSCDAKPAAIAKPAATRATAKGIRSETRPMRSMPRASLRCLCLALAPDDGFA